MILRVREKVKRGERLEMGVRLFVFGWLLFVVVVGG